MKKKFVIPNQLQDVAKHVICEIIRHIPDEWLVLRGVLHAPQYMLHSGEASRTTRLVFASSTQQMITNVRGDESADICGIIIDGKKPHSIEFGTGIGYCEVMPMSQSKLMTAHYVNLEYSGRLHFKHSDPEDREDKPTMCEIWIPPYRKMRLATDTQITIKLASNDTDLGMIAPVLKICESLLTEVTE